MYYNNYNRMEIIHVNGMNGAQAFQMPPNSNVLLLDDTEPIVWLKQTDGAGYPSLTPYKIEPYKPAPPADMKALEDRIKRLEAMLNESHTTAVKPDTGISAGNVDD